MTSEGVAEEKAATFLFNLVLNHYIQITFPSKTFKYFFQSTRFSLYGSRKAQVMN
jgi:hypothetical protein